MLIYKRVIEPSELIEIQPNLVLPEWENSSKFLQELITRMAEDPLRYLVLFVRRPSRELVAFVVCEYLYPILWILQAWSHPSNSWSVTDQLFKLVKLWGVMNGCQKLQIETRRIPDGFIRRFGFKVKTTIMELNLEPEITTFLSKDNNNG